MIEKITNLSKIKFPQIKIDGHFIYALPLDQIQTPKDMEMALDLIDEMKRREGRQEFFGNGAHHKLHRR